MIDTTTTIDEILGTLDSRYGDWAKCDTTYMKEYLDEAKQALLRWHKDKARSYVPEKKQKTFQGTENLDSIQYAHLSGAWEGFNHCIDQTLKAIGGEE